MKNTLFLTTILSSLVVSSSVTGADISDPKAYIKEHFWGNLYKDGGITFYCKEPFKGKSILIDEAYIYSDGWIRDELNCGSPRQCRQNSEDYRKMVTDMHNIYPAESRFELKRKNAKFEFIGDEVAAGDCGVKRSFNIIEPADDIKGDVARAIFYMHKTYNLPIVGSTGQLKRWHINDPVSPEEAERNRKISEIQGNGNVFITNPDEANNLQ
ncbi:MAG: endonuclease [Hahellaceae bacterium]|nr:endonuclease [Hahellaceae bacterium]MCP5211182.1 endonuclease [Hahellaceae bacterium]